MRLIFGLAYDFVIFHCVRGPCGIGREHGLRIETDVAPGGNQRVFGAACPDRGVSVLGAVVGVMECVNRCELLCCVDPRFRYPGRVGVPQVPIDEKS